MHAYPMGWNYVCSLAYAILCMSTTAADVLLLGHVWSTTLFITQGSFLYDLYQRIPIIFKQISLKNKLYFLVQITFRVNSNISQVMWFVFKIWCSSPIAWFIIWDFKSEVRMLGNSLSSENRCLKTSHEICRVFYAITVSLLRDLFVMCIVGAKYFLNGHQTSRVSHSDTGWQRLLWLAICCQSTSCWSNEVGLFFNLMYLRL